MSFKNNTDKKTSFISKLTGEIIGHMTLIEILHDKELSVGGCRGVIEYDPQCLILDTISGYVRIIGKNLNLTAFQGDILIVSGKITSVCLEDYD